MDASFWVAMASIWVVFGIACSVIANSKGRNPVGWFFVGVLLGLIGLIIILALPRTIASEAARAAQLSWAAGAGAPLPIANAPAARCPFCAEQIQPEAVVCRWCGRDLPQGAVIAPSAVPAPASPPGVAPPAPVVIPVTRTVVEPGASVRDTPAGSAVAYLPAGTRVTAYEQSGAWVRVEGPGGAAGWLRESELLRVRAPGTQRHPGGVMVGPAMGRTWRVAEPGTDLRGTPGGGPVVAHLTAGTALVEAGRDGEFVRVNTPDRLSGWVHRREVF